MTLAKPGPDIANGVQKSKHPVLPHRPGMRAMRLSDGAMVESWDFETKGMWLDVESPASTDLEKLQQGFSLNALALEDALDVGHWARFEVYPEHAFLIFRTLAEPEDVTSRTERVSFFWFPNLGSLITFRNEPVTYLEGVWKEMLGKHGRKPMDVMFALLSRGSDTFFSFLDELETLTDELEERVLDGSRGRDAREFTEEVFDLKHTLIYSRRLVSGAREAVAQFARHAITIEPAAGIFLRDVSDHLTRVYEGVDSAREVLSSLLDVHLSVQSNRMNEVMKTLTAVSAIFLPLTFLAGVWGMNYRFMPELQQPWGYAFAWMVFLCTACGLFLFFKRKGWF